MVQKISAPISVDLLYDHRKHTVIPRQIFWDGQNLRIDQVGLHHTFRQGRTLFHIFSVVSGPTSFRLSLNTDSLFWTLEELSDGLAG